MRAVAIIVGFVLGCGGDEPAAVPKNPNATTVTAPTPQPGAVGAGSGRQLQPQTHIEDRVTCPSPQEGSQKCDPAAPREVVIGQAKDTKDKPPNGLTCNEGEYCLATSKGYLCGPCPERDTIRHVFRERDFVAENNRDPFQPLVIKPLGAGSGSSSAIVDGTRCQRAEQLRVSNYGFQDLKLVGIVAQGTQRKVLMMDPGNFGHIIKRGDCVGKEKAWVKDIGENFICFEMAPDQSAAGRPVDALCVELHTKQVAVTSLPNDQSAPATRNTTTTPVIAPPPMLPPRGTGQGSAPPPPQVPLQAPTNLRP